jgi:hypothetical protein
METPNANIRAKSEEREDARQPVELRLLGRTKSYDMRDLSKMLMASGMMHDPLLLLR